LNIECPPYDYFHWIDQPDVNLKEFSLTISLDDENQTSYRSTRKN